MAILTGGPWTVQGSILSLMPWKANFQPLQQTIKTALVWIRLPGLPLEYWSPESVANIASMVGKPLRMDDRSFSLLRGRFARVCVELDLEQPLTEGVWVGEEDEENFFQIVSYENLPVLCKSCGCLGHLAHNCMNPATKHDQNLEGSCANTPSNGTTGSTPAENTPPFQKSPQWSFHRWALGFEFKGERGDGCQHGNLLEYLTSRPRRRMMLQWLPKGRQMLPPQISAHDPTPLPKRRLLWIVFLLNRWPNQILFKLLFCDGLILIFSDSKAAPVRRIVVPTILALRELNQIQA